MRRLLASAAGALSRTPRTWCGALELTVASAAAAETTARFVASPPLDRRNDHYVGNRAPLAPTSSAQDERWRLRAVVSPGIAWYRALYRAIGEEWLWTSRLRKSDAELAALLNAEGVEVYALTSEEQDCGLLELDFRIAGEGEGWNVAMATAGFERGLMLRSPARFQETARRLVELYKANRAHADRDPAVRDAVLRAYLDAEAYTLSTYATASRLVQGGHIGAESSTNKVFWSELDIHMHDTALAILGQAAEVAPAGQAPGSLGHWLDGFLFSQAGPIYAGTNEIQRNIVAERILGLPREPKGATR